ncbi:MAG: AraC family transcriptional regulator [Planctomycetota bacterium]
MHEKLTLPPKCHGRCWRHEPHGRLYHWHHHDEPEFNLVVRGTARYLLGDRRYDLGPGCLVWLFPRQEHVLTELSDDFVCWISVIRPTPLRRAARGPTYSSLRAADPPGHFCKRLVAADMTLLTALCRDVATQQDPQRFNLGNLHLFLAAWEAFTRAPDLPDPQRLHPAVERAVALISADPETELTAVARRAGLSASRLSRLFHRQVGQTLVAWRVRVRLERFLGLRRKHPQRTLLALALTAGFGSYAQFHRTFRTAMGVGPGQWGHMETPTSSTLS